jgi:putative polyketide hydroxylase
MAKEHQLKVLVVGAGGAGLSLTLLLLQQGIRPLLIERRSEVSLYSRTRNLNFRTMEIFRSLGLAGAIHEVGASVSRVFAREHLASKDEKVLLDPGSLLDTTPLSPEPFLWFCPQSRLEPILLAAARDRGADVRYGTELTSFVQDARGISAILKDLSTGRSETVQAQFLIGCDGSHSPTRAALDIPTHGKGELDEHYVFIYFRALWGDFIRGHESDAFMIENADVRGMFLVADENLGMFVMVQGPKDDGVSDGLSRERAAELVNKAIGQTDIPVEIVEVSPWRPVQYVADRFQSGRTFLVGDAAHTMPPKEGEGVNMAIQSAQNLGWKLAAVLKGQASLNLLSTYTTERYPVAGFVAEHSLTGDAAAIPRLSVGMVRMLYGNLDASRSHA